MLTQRFVAGDQLITGVYLGRRVDVALGFKYMELSCDVKVWRYALRMCDKCLLIGQWGK